MYHGRQVNFPLGECEYLEENPIDESEMSPVPPPFQFVRRVYMYPVEYRSYGPDGVNVAYMRNDQGAMVKRFMVTDHQGSVVMVAGEDCEDHIRYNAFGTEIGAWTYRTGYLDRETDDETSPHADSLKLLDLVVR